MRAMTVKHSRYSKEQKEGVARFFDAIAAASLIGAIVGATGHSLIRTWEIIALLIICPIPLRLSWELRRPTS